MTALRPWTLFLALSLCATPGIAFAHAFGQRYDLPLPLGFYLAGAGLAVALSFLGSFAFMRAGSGMRFSLLIPAPEVAGRAAANLARGVALALLALVLTTAVFGPSSATHASVSSPKGLGSLAPTPAAPEAKASST